MENTIKLIEARNRYTSKKTEQLAEQNDKTAEVGKKNTTEPSNMVMETVSNENFVILNNTIASLSYTLQEHESRGFKIEVLEICSLSSIGALSKRHHFETPF